MENNVFQLSHVIKNIHWNKFYQLHTHRRKGFLELLLLKVCGSFLFRQSEKKTSGSLWSVRVFFTFLEKRRLNKYCLWEANLVFYMNIFALIRLSAKFIKQQFKILVVLSPTFVADTKIIFAYNFIAPLICEDLNCELFLITFNRPFLFSFLFFYYYYYFFSIWVLFYGNSRITGLQGKGEYISLTPHYHFHSLYRHLKISWAITVESSPLHIEGSRSQTGTFGFRAQVANH